MAAIKFGLVRVFGLFGNAIYSRIRYVKYGRGS